MKTKIAIPLENELLCSHFGHCNQFAIFEVEEKEILELSVIDTPEHKPGAYPKFLGDKGVKVVIAGGMGTKAQDLFRKQNIELFTGITENNPKELLQLYLSGNLKSKEVKCNHHH